MKVLTVIGTRPEALKLGPVIQCLARTPGVQSLVCTTGQHRELLTDALALFGVRPDFDLAVMRPRQTPGTVLAAILQRLEPLLAQVRPDWLVVVGDTTSALGAGIAAHHCQVRLAHVEAGLRSGSRRDPFPEEANRRLLSVLAELNIAPTAQARENLRQENIPSRAIRVTGNPVIDTLRQCGSRPAPPAVGKVLRQLGLGAAPAPGDPRLVVVTCHRRENHGAPLRQVCAAVRDLAARNRGSVRILFVVHPNPAVRGTVRRELAGVRGVTLAEPLAYPTLIGLLRRAYVVLTDSGGLQEEAPWLRVPVLVLRDNTERPEGVAAGVARLVGTRRQAIVAATQRLLDRPAVHRAMAKGFRGYGDGHAAPRIVRALARHLG